MRRVSHTDDKRSQLILTSGYFQKRSDKRMSGSSDHAGCPAFPHLMPCCPKHVAGAHLLLLVRDFLQCEFSLQHQQGPFHALVYWIQFRSKEQRNLVWWGWQLFSGLWWWFSLWWWNFTAWQQYPTDCNNWHLSQCWLMVFCGNMTDMIDQHPSPMLTRVRIRTSRKYQSHTTGLIHWAINTLENAYTGSATLAQIHLNTTSP